MVFTLGWNVVTEMFSRFSCALMGWKGQFFDSDLPLALLYWQLNMEERSELNGFKTSMS